MEIDLKSCTRKKVGPFFLMKSALKQKSSFSLNSENTVRNQLLTSIKSIELRNCSTKIYLLSWPH